MSNQEADSPRGKSDLPAYTWTIYTGSHSHDSFHGNRYSGIKTADQSAGMFGNIEKSGDPTNECPYGEPSGQSEGGEFRQRRWQSSRAAQLNKPTPANECSREMDSSYLTPHSGHISRERSTSRSQSLSNFPSTLVEQPSSLSTEPEQKMFRKDTASWFEQGKVFEVSPDTSATITNAGVTSCPLLVVIYRRDSSITCLPLRRHSSITQQNVDFLNSRIRIYARGKQTIDDLPECPWKPLPIDVKAGYESLEDMWINIERPHTIENVQEVEVALLGTLDDDGVGTLRDAYLRTQLRNVTRPREKSQATLFWLFQCILRRIWTGFLSIFQ